MNIQVFSNTQNQLGDVNYNNKFTMTLPEQIDGENKKRFIRALNVTYPVMIDNVEDKSCGIRFSYKLCWNSATPATQTQVDYIVFERDWAFLPRGHYTLKKNIKDLNRIVNYGVKFSLLPGGRVSVSVNITPHYVFRYGDSHNLTHDEYIVKMVDDFSFEMTKDLKYMLGLDGYVLHPVVERIFLKGGLKSGPFTWTDSTPPTELQAMLTTILHANYLNKSTSQLWYFFYGKYAPDMTNGKTRMFIYCDEVVPSIVGDVRGPLLAHLQIVPHNEMVSGGLHTHNLSSIKRELINTLIKHLHIRICDIENNLIQFNGGFAETTTEDVYYNLASKRSNVGSFDMASFWCAHALHFSGMANGETKKISGRWSEGTLTNYKNNSISMSGNALQAMVFDDHLLTHMFGNATVNTVNINHTKKKLPQYLLVRDLAQLKENVIFYVLWGDNKNIHTGSLNGKQITLVLNLFEDNNG
ncbi:Hypothetical predicted protein [Paramuricea clavata]|uniref:Uncharacterized protein n=1 Tax=Paramuricea clavata TaxID=317549 RepID=A0A7D9H9G2_PARCT|nr:Hypothetical predicted protein [Paramuricea clavata]